jgi:hypothetical protein
MNKKILNLTDSSSADSSGEGEMRAQLNRKEERKVQIWMVPKNK